MIAISHHQSAENKAERWKCVFAIHDDLGFACLISVDSHLHVCGCSLWVVHGISSRFTIFWSTSSSISNASILPLPTYDHLHHTTCHCLSHSFLVLRLDALIPSLPSLVDDDRCRSERTVGTEDPPLLNSHHFYVRLSMGREDGAKRATDEFER